MEGNGNSNADANTSSLEKLSGLIFDLGEKIPEGVYLEMMDHTKKIYEEVQQLQKLSEKKKQLINDDNDVITMVVNYEHKIWVLKNIEISSSNKGVFVSFNNSFGTLRYGKVGMFIRLFSGGESFKFMRITKINSKSIQYDIIEINTTWGSIRKYIKKGNTLKTQEGDNLIELGEYKTKGKILFYETRDVICYCILNMNDTDAILNMEDTDFQTDNNLSIWT